MGQISSLLLFLFICQRTLTSEDLRKLPLIHHCQVESYTDSIFLPDCSTKSFPIETTRCRGQCYSEGELHYQWRSSQAILRHEQLAHCCTPNHTISYQTKVICQNRQTRLIDYQIITRCQCRNCEEKCSN